VACSLRGLQPARNSLPRRPFLGGCLTLGRLGQQQVPGMSFPQIRGFSAVYSSDMIRAQETARILCGQEPPLAET